MTIEYFGVHSNPFDSPEYIRLKLGGDIPISSTCKIVIERPGQSQPYLAQSGWQSNYAKQVVEVIIGDSQTFDLCLPISLARFLNAEYNYKIDLLDMSDNFLGVFGMNWVPPPRITIPPASLKGNEEELVHDEEPEVPEITSVTEPEILIEQTEIKVPIAVSRSVENCGTCGGQIFSTFTICPYCSTPFKRD